ncbi:glutamyl aminopeptidase-like [Cotesia glomerata]|uniref:glutamyl aminopeptidase-like n=1 Tax=Cotesia glomerata TaxID=32391 RepID=UPI001D025E79|nr:glutamyl aminopeptidase-like [Cotesia glomerata]
MKHLNRKYLIYSIIKLIVYGVLIQFKMREVASNSEISSIHPLPDYVKPIHYAIKIMPLLKKDNWTYDGESDIEIQIKQKSNFLVLYAKNLEISDNITIENENGMHQSVNYKIDNETDFLTITFQEELSEGIHTLHLRYRGKVNDEAQGLYRSSYTDIYGENRGIINDRS